MDGNRPKDNEKPDRWQEFFGRGKPDDTPNRTPEEPIAKDSKKAEHVPDKDEAKKPAADAEPEKKQEKRKAKRSQVIRRSRAQLEEAEARDPYQTSQYSPIERVQLAVARQIVSLDTRLRTDESLDEDDVASLEHSIDFMGLMTDKLLNPELETAPEVEAAVAVLLEPLLEPSLDAAPMTDLAEQQRSLNADMKDMSVAIASTTPIMIQEWLDEPSAPRETTMASAGVTGSDGPAQKPETKTEPTYKFTRIDPEQILETANDYRRMVPTVMRVLKKERKKKQGTIQPSVVVGASATVGSPSATPTASDEVENDEPTNSPIGGKYPVHQKVKTLESRSGLSAVVSDVPTGENSIEPTPKPAPHQRPGQKSEHLAETIDEREVERSAPAIKPHKKVEHMSLRELLHEAENIPVGHGQYLRRAYETGEIDQKGLADVIKSYQKGRDFKREFSAKRAAYRYQRTNSPETGQEAPEARTTSDDSTTLPRDNHGVNDNTADVNQHLQPSAGRAAATNPATQPASGQAPRDDRAALLGSILQGNSAQSKDSFVKQAAMVVAAGSGIALVGWLLFSIF